MASPFAMSAVRFAGAFAIQQAPAASIVISHPTMAAAAANTTLIRIPEPPPLPPPRVSLPVLSSRTGNLFADSNDPNLHWYLGEFILHEDIDTGFAFTASQGGQDENGNPFYTAQLTLTLSVQQPADVVAFAASNPGASLRQIPLNELVPTFSSFFTNTDGTVRQRDAIGSARDTGGGNYLLTFTPLLGASVIGAYQDLTVFAKAQIGLTASFQAWSAPDQLVQLRPRSAMLQAAAFRPVYLSANTAVRPIASTLMQADMLREPTPTPPAVQSRFPWQSVLLVAGKYMQDSYQLKYTVSTANISNQVIRDANDLREFTRAGSEFRELKALGDISERYPSLSRAYIGSLSRTIVVIPDHYSIVRSRTGCAAVCMALVDSAGTNGSQCKFEFDFTVAPDVSRTEFLQLAHEIAGNPDLKDYKLKFPDFLQDGTASQLQTIFKSSVQFTEGVDPHTFLVSVSIQDDGIQTPAVANANLFIVQLCASSGIPLLGCLNLKLDDGYTSPVPATLILNFAHTAGSDEMDIELDAASGQVNLVNRSPLDLQVSRYAFAGPSTLTVVPAATLLAAGYTTSIPLPADQADASLVIDAQLALPAPLTKSAVARFLSFQTTDVQQTQYVVAVDGSGINFTKVDSLVATITFSNLPQVTPQVLTLNGHFHADSTHLIVPLENAVFRLPGEVSLTVKFAGGAPPDLQFSLQNDFTAQPVLVILQGDIDSHL